MTKTYEENTSAAFHLTGYGLAVIGTTLSLLKNDSVDGAIKKLAEAEEYFKKVLSETLYSEKQTNNSAR